MCDDFDIGDEEQEAIEAMVTWRERGEWPPLRHKLHELDRILDREMGRALHDVERHIGEDPQELADMGYDSDELDDIEWED